MPASSGVATTTAPARPSSTVVLLRDADPTPEVLMVQRHARSSFGAAYAFPGGVVEADDRKVRARCAGLRSDDADALLGTANALDYYSSAIRELFEETGVLLAQHGELAISLDRARAGLNNQTLSWHTFVVENDLALSCDELEYFSFWVTPDALPKRYATRFFVAQLPAGQEAAHCGGELTDSAWMTPRNALAAGEAGDMLLHFPTFHTLNDLAAHTSVAAIRDWCRQCQDNGVPCLHPTIVDGRPVIL